MKNSTKNSRGERHQTRGLTRRGFLKTSGAASAAVVGGAWLAPAARARGAGGQDVFVQVFLRGGMDGLTTCVPYGDGDLYVARPNLAIGAPGTTNGAVDLDGFFGLAPSAAGLKLPFDNGHLAIIHATGSTDPTRSHFDAMKALERGLPGQDFAATSSGWLGRHLAATASPASLRALAFGHSMPTHLDGAPAALPIADPEAFALPGAPATSLVRERVIRRMYAGSGDPLESAAASTFETIALLAGVDFASYTPAFGASYPDSPFGRQLRQSAALIKAGVGLEAISIDYGGWDHHNQLGPIDGVMASMLADLSAGLVAFYKDLRLELGGVTVAVLSEFGRRVRENGSAGLDHGHGNCMLLMGGNVAGGQVHAQWPSLALAALDEGDLAITTDYRDVLGEVLSKRLGAPDLSVIFPGHTMNFPGVIV